MRHAPLSLWRVVALTLLIAAAEPLQASSFTYQGRLKDGSNPANGLYDLEFRLFGVAAGGSPIGSPVVLPDVAVAEGLFTVILNSANQFGAGAFDGSPRWLEIVVEGTTLTPRQPITAAPYAWFAAAPWSTGAGTLSYVGGNVGIGTSAPTAPLHINAAGCAPGSDALRAVSCADALVFGHTNLNYRSTLGSTSGGGAPFLMFHGEHSDATPNAIRRDGTGLAPLGLLHDGTSLRLLGAPAGAPQSDATLSTLMSWAPSGRVGLGTATPAAMVDVVSNQGASGDSALRATFPGGGSLAGTEFAALANRGGGTWWAMYARQGAAAAAGYFDGNVGIGAATPGSPLSVLRAINRHS